MQCVFCNRKPHEIPKYVKLANTVEMSAHEYVRMDEPTYHLPTDMFCCHSCYFEQGSPFYLDLVRAYKRFRKNVIPLERG